MAEGAVEIEDHLLHVAALGGLFFCDAHVAIADALGHFAWAEIAANELYAFRQEIAHAREDLLKIRDAAAKSAGAEKKNFLARELGEKGGGFGVASTFVGPEADVDALGGERLRVWRAEIQAVVCGERLVQGVGEHFCVAGLAGINDGISHDILSFAGFSYYNRKSPRSRVRSG